jgi:hypothetical protein
VAKKHSERLPVIKIVPLAIGDRVEMLPAEDLLVDETRRTEVISQTGEVGTVIAFRLRGLFGEEPVVQTDEQHFWWPISRLRRVKED